MTCGATPPAVRAVAMYHWSCFARWPREPTAAHLCTTGAALARPLWLWQSEHDERGLLLAAGYRLEQKPLKGLLPRSAWSYKPRRSASVVTGTPSDSVGKLETFAIYDPLGDEFAELFSCAQ